MDLIGFDFTTLDFRLSKESCCHVKDYSIINWSAMPQILGSIEYFFDDWASELNITSCCKRDMILSLNWFSIDHFWSVIH